MGVFAAFSLLDAVYPVRTGGAAHHRARDGVFVGLATFAGVVDTDHDGATLRIIARTRPGQHFCAGRQLRLRVLERLRDSGIVWVHPAANESARAT